MGRRVFLISRGEIYRRHNTLDLTSNVEPQRNIRLDGVFNKSLNAVITNFRGLAERRSEVKALKHLA